MTVLIVSLGVLAALYPPSAWWGYLVGVASCAFLIAMAVLEVKRTWIAVDEVSVHVSDASWGHRVMSRDSVATIEAVGIVWKIRGKHGEILRLRPVWSKKQLMSLAEELHVPIRV
jgi:hypothetical protein